MSGIATLQAANEALAALRFEDALALAGDAIAKGLDLDAPPAERGAFVEHRETARAEAVRALAAMRLGRLDEALGFGEAAVRCAPEEPDALAARGRVRHVRGEHAEALADFGRVLGRRPEFGPALYRRAHCLEDLGRHAEAEVDVSVILRGHPQDADARALFDRVRAAQGLPHGDADLPRPETRDQWMARASAAAVQGDHAAVVEAYDHVLRLAPGLTVLRLYRGASLEALGQYARAAQDYEAYLRIEPAHQWAKDRLAAARSKLAAG